MYRFVVKRVQSVHMELTRLDNFTRSFWKIRHISIFLTFVLHFCHLFYIDLCVDSPCLFFGHCL